MPNVDLSHESVLGRAMNNLLPLVLLTLLGLGSVGCASSGAATQRDVAELYSCEMSFTLEGWSAVYRRANGEGRVVCSNGEEATVALRVRGGGLTAGKTEILNGSGKFSGVKNLDEIYGGYVAAGANAAAVKASEAVAMTKGPVSLAIAGTGRGFSLGVDITRFSIRRVDQP